MGLVASPFESGAVHVDLLSVRVDVHLSSVDDGVLQDIGHFQAPAAGYFDL